MAHQQHLFNLVTGAVTPSKPSTSSRECGETCHESMIREPLFLRDLQHFKLMLRGCAWLKMLRKRLDQEFFWGFKLFLHSPWMNVHSSVSELPQLRGFHHPLMAFANRVFASSVALRAELRPQWGPWRKPEEEVGCLELVQQGLFSPSMTRQAWSSVLMHCRNAEMDSQ